MWADAWERPFNHLAGLNVAQAWRADLLTPESEENDLSVKAMPSGLQDWTHADKQRRKAAEKASERRLDDGRHVIKDMRVSTGMLHSSM